MPEGWRFSVLGIRGEMGALTSIKAGTQYKTSVLVATIDSRKFSGEGRTGGVHGLYIAYTTPTMICTHPLIECKEPTTTKIAAAYVPSNNQGAHDV